MNKTICTAEFGNDDFIENFLQEGNYSPATKESYRYALKRVAKWLEQNNLTFDDMTLAIYRRFINANNWAGNSQRMYGASLRAFYKWLGKPDHPIFTERLPRDTAAPGRVLDLNQLRDLLASFDTTTVIGWRNLAMVALMAETGLRATEICRLEVQNVDLQQNRFTAQVKGKKGEKRYREGVFSHDVARFLAMWMGERANIAKKGVKFLFVSIGGTRHGTQMTRGGLRAIFRRFGEQAQIGKLSPHDMRRTMALLLTEEGAPTRLVQVLGGWEDIRLVERYTARLQAKQIDRYSMLKSVSGRLGQDQAPVEADEKAVKQ